MEAKVLDRRFDFEFRADPAFVGYAVEITRIILRYHGVRRFDDMLVVLTELLRTTMDDETGVRAGKPVRVRVELLPEDHYCLTVEDSGPALDRLRFLDPSKNEPHRVLQGLGRSYSLLHALADEVLVSERGNSVRVSGQLSRDFPGYTRGGIHEGVSGY